MAEIKTPRDKYLHDPVYASFVDMMTAHIASCHITPSEVREAAMLACINYQMMHVGELSVVVPGKVEAALELLDSWRNGKQDG